MAKRKTDKAIQTALATAMDAWQAPTDLDEYLRCIEDDAITLQDAGIPLPEDVRQSVLDTIRWALETRTAFVEHRYTDAVGAAIRLGMSHERLSVQVFVLPHAEHGKKSRQSLALGPAAKRKAAQADYERINAAIAARLKKRGRHKTPSLTKIRKDVADQLGVPKQRVLDAAAGGRKK